MKQVWTVLCALTLFIMAACTSTVSSKPSYNAKGETKSWEIYYRFDYEQEAGDIDFDGKKDIANLETITLSYKGNLATLKKLKNKKWVVTVEHSRSKTRLEQTINHQLIEEGYYTIKDSFDQNLVDGEEVTITVELDGQKESVTIPIKIH
jgi:hypothetical protein